VATLSTAQKTAPASGATPAKALAYTFSNVRIASHPAAVGNQLTAELSYTEDGCTATYDVAALWPSTYCGDDAGSPDDTICAEAFPDYTVKCDAAQLSCVLDGATKVPAYKE
jgi:hypothetical protein